MFVKRGLQPLQAAVDIAQAQPRVGNREGRTVRCGRDGQSGPRLRRELPRCALACPLACLRYIRIRPRKKAGHAPIPWPSASSSRLLPYGPLPAEPTPGMHMAAGNPVPGQLPLARSVNGTVVASGVVGHSSRPPTPASESAMIPSSRNSLHKFNNLRIFPSTHAVP
jgi:hypothetical protein